MFPKKVLYGFLIEKHVKSIIYSHSIVKLLSKMTINQNEYKNSAKVFIKFFK